MKKQKLIITEKLTLQLIFDSLKKLTEGELNAKNATKAAVDKAFVNLGLTPDRYY